MMSSTWFVQSDCILVWMFCSAIPLCFRGGIRVLFWMELKVLPKMKHLICLLMYVSVCWLGLTLWLCIWFWGYGNCWLWRCCRILWKSFTCICWACLRFVVSVFAMFVCVPVWGCWGRLCFSMNLTQLPVPVICVCWFFLPHSPYQKKVWNCGVSFEWIRCLWGEKLCRLDRQSVCACLAFKV